MFYRHWFISVSMTELERMKNQPFNHSMGKVQRKKKISFKELLQILGKLNRKHCKKEVEESEAAEVESD